MCFELVGGYSTGAEAARAHDKVSIKIKGSNTLTNFPVCHIGYLWILLIGKKLIL